MLDSILQPLPADIREDLNAHVRTCFALTLPAFPTDSPKGRLDELAGLAGLTGDEILDLLTHWTGHAVYSHEIDVLTMIVLKRVEIT